MGGGEGRRGIIPEGKTFQKYSKTEMQICEINDVN